MIDAPTPRPYAIHIALLEKPGVPPGWSPTPSLALRRLLFT